MLPVTRATLTPEAQKKPRLYTFHMTYLLRTNTFHVSYNIIQYDTYTFRVAFYIYYIPAGRCPRGRFPDSDTPSHRVALLLEESLSLHEAHAVCVGNMDQQRENQALGTLLAPLQSLSLLPPTSLVSLSSSSRALFGMFVSKYSRGDVPTSARLASRAISIRFYIGISR
jgi:hypothetical protein